MLYIHKNDVFFQCFLCLLEGPWSLVCQWNQQIPRLRHPPGRLLHEISCRLPHSSGDTASTLQLHWADAMLGPVEKGGGDVPAGFGDHFFPLGEIHEFRCCARSQLEDDVIKLRQDT